MRNCVPIFLVLFLQHNTLLDLQQVLAVCVNKMPYGMYDYTRLVLCIAQETEWGLIVEDIIPRVKDR